MDERREARALQSESMDEEDHFVQQIAAVLQRLPNRDEAMAKLKIQQMLFEFEFQYNNYHDNSSQIKINNILIIISHLNT